MPDTPLRGTALLVAVVNHILDHPETWDQRHWHCGTTHCFGGWTQIMGGLPEDPDTCHEDAQRLLELSDEDAGWLFSAYRTLREIHAYAEAMAAGRDYFDRDGYNRAGYDRDGYDRDGYDRAGRPRPNTPIDLPRLTYPGGAA